METTKPDQPRLRILVLSDVSGLGLGGVPVFNMELCKGLAQRHDVTLLTVDPDDRYDAASMGRQHGDTRIVNVPDFTPGREPREALESLVKGSPAGYGLLAPGDEPFQLVIGHSRFSGPAAKSIREQWFPDARLIHFLHTSPVRLDKIKNRWEKGARNAVSERRIMHRADLVTGVGALLTAECERLSDQVLHVPGLHEFVPGTEIGELIAGPHGGAERVDLLLPGRATDEIKGVDNAIRTMGILKQRHGATFHLTVRGGPDPVKEPAEHQKWVAKVKEYGAEGNVTLLPFTKNPDDLVKDRERADAVIMPSLHEGFGLVATEAAGRGIPVLVNAESGAAGFFDKAPGGGNCVVRVHEGESVPEAWAEALEGLRQDLSGRWDEARTLYGYLSEYSWEHAGDAMAQAAMQTAPATQRSFRQRYFGRRTRQGPGGTVVPAGTRTEWTVGPWYDGSVGWAPGAAREHAAWHEINPLTRSQSVKEPARTRRRPALQRSRSTPARATVTTT
ncbi:glycosyltransferase family 4 protein [Streptomyces sp. NPDC048340]|uniref:glycosyltransferase family 4 protein n=1 Tax=Streptomyces sp. NPDC048340 TaxID=3365537 RepID=UPI00371F06F1